MYVEKLRKEIEKYCDKTNYDLIKAKETILGNKKAIKDWIENTKIVEEDGRLDGEYFSRTVVGILEGNNVDYPSEIQKMIKDIENE